MAEDRCEDGASPLDPPEQDWQYRREPILPGSAQMLDKVRDLPVDAFHFFRSWVADPRRVSAVAPSSESLARLITREVVADHGPVLELGPGTGVFTHALLERGVREEDLTLVESGPAFVELLRGKFPAARVLCLDATRLARHELFPPDSVGTVISGLPMLSMSCRERLAVVRGVLAYLRPGGAVYQFTYGPVCPVQRLLLERFGLKAVRVGSTLRNLPPASVYRITR